MLRRGVLLLLAILLGSASGCGTTKEPLWYKPGGNYTTAEFNRDRDACTRDKKLDTECLRARGWVSVTPDLATPAADPRAQRPDRRP